VASVVQYILHMPAQRIVSFLPAATEIICALGLEDRLVGVTHECDYPLQVRAKPVVVRSALPTEEMTPAEIDVAVTDRLRGGESLYLVDEAKLRAVEPDLIVTQDLCQVCAPSGNEIAQVLRALPTRPEILWLTPKSMADIEANIRDLGVATGTDAEAERLIADGRSRLAQIASLVADTRDRPRVFCLEWVDPVYCSGHWVPEMVELAGGMDALGRRGTDSVRISWDEVVEFAPAVLVVMPCGYSLEQARSQAMQLAGRPGWYELPAVKEGRVHAVDANAYFARPGPRLARGVELLAHLLHPGLVPWTGPATAYHTFDTNRQPVAAR
jgi:iron complex transport system substrate-binding protein